SRQAPRERIVEGSPMTPRPSVTASRVTIARNAAGGQMTRPIETLSAAEARRLALAAQGFGQDRPRRRPSSRQLLHLLHRLGLLQIDSVNVLIRAHYLPLFSRLGSYDATLLDAAAYAGPERALFEYWGHQASLLPVALHPLLRWRMARAERGFGMYRSL